MENVLCTLESCILCENVYFIQDGPYMNVAIGENDTPKLACHRGGFHGTPIVIQNISVELELFCKRWLREYISNQDANQLKENFIKKCWPNG